MKVTQLLAKNFVLNAFFVTLALCLCINTVNADDTNTEPITSEKCNEFTFDASGSYDPDNENISFFWDFGDGITSLEPVVNHSYDKSGEYTVELSITDNSGLDCSTAYSVNKVKATIPPFASFSVEDNFCTDQPVDFDASPSFSDNKRKLNYSWDFGDGTTIDGRKKVTKVYTKGGNYNITLNVNDGNSDSCHESSFEKRIYINEPPVAEAGDDAILKCVTGDIDMVVSFDASNSYDTNNDKLSYSWDFGDGLKEEGMHATHRYTQVGIYDVKLVVKDNTEIGCGTSVDFVTVKLNKAPKANAGSDIIACTGEAVVFDGSKSYAETKGTLDSSWFFGDGESSKGLKVTHVYNKPGKYQANLTVENSLNSMCPPSSDTRMVAVNSTPTVTIKAVDSVCLGNTVHFDATSAMDPDGDSLEYYWSFGDGSILKSGPKVAHDYAQGGNYRVTVIVDDGKGSACSTATAIANIKINTAPIADAGTNSTCCVDKNTQFDASASSDADGDDLTYTWDFGDGTVQTGEKTSHIYTTNGDFDVLLTVDDNSGTSCSTSTIGYKAKVNAKPVAIMTIK